MSVEIKEEATQQQLAVSPPAVGASGLGKSAFLNEVAQHLARGANVRIIDVGRSYENWMFLLRQKPESIQKIESGGALAFTPHMLEMLRSLRTEQGAYSEVFVYGGQVGYGVGMLLLDPYSQLMGSANARDFEAVRAKIAQGMTMAAAIEAVLQDRGIAE
jgi:hypothetical protein